MNLLLLCGTAAAAGALGSAHCLGMCGPVVTLLETGEAASALARRLACNVGRLCGYVVLGAVAATAGSLFTLVPGGSTLLGIAAATIMVLIGLQLAFDLPLLRGLERAGGRVWRALAPLARRVLPANTVPRACAAGLLWGALPCGLVYSAAALAAASGGAWQGAAVMAGFWAGTLPALLLAGSAAGQLARWKRQPRTRRLAGALLCLGGAMALVLPLRHPGHDASASSALPRTATGETVHRAH